MYLHKYLSRLVCLVLLGCNILDTPVTILLDLVYLSDIILEPISTVFDKVSVDHYLYPMVPMYFLKAMFMKG